MNRAELAGLTVGLGMLLWGGYELRAQLVGPKSEDGCCKLSGAGFGMTADQVRERFEPGASGTWTETQEGRDRFLDWKRSEATERAPREVRFELHEGLLTGVRARLDPQSLWAAGPAKVETPLLVTVRRKEADGSVSYVSLARDCSRQRNEVARLLATPPPPSGSVVAP